MSRGVERERERDRVVVVVVEREREREKVLSLVPSVTLRLPLFASSSRTSQRGSPVSDVSRICRRNKVGERERERERGWEREREVVVG